MRFFINSTLLILSFTITAWAATQFVQPQLPTQINVAVYYAFLALTSAAGFLGAFKNTIELMRLFDEHNSRRILLDKFSRGPYDEGTIQRSTNYYISPKCSNVDPSQEAELRHAPFVVEASLFAKVDDFLDHVDLHRHLLILADSGTGKTSFVLNYYAHNARRFRRKHHNLALVPLGINNADELISSIPDPENTVLFLDAFDEDAKAIFDHHSRIRALMEECSRFSRVIITCRTQFFPKDEEIPVETGILKLAPRKAGEKGTYEFWKLYLSPFSDEDVKKYLNMRYPIWSYRSRRKAYAVASTIPHLSVRPMLLAHIPDLVDRGETISRSYELYETMIDAWLERESHWVDKTHLRRFSEELAIDMYLHAEARGTERIPLVQLTNVSAKTGINLQSWQLKGRSLLNRDAEGNYKFAHRSIMEYLFVNRLVSGDRRCCGMLLTDEMKHFLIEMLNPKPLNYLFAGWILSREVFAFTENVGTDPTIFLQTWKNGAFALKVMQEGPFDEQVHTPEPLAVDFKLDLMSRPSFTIVNPNKWELHDSEFSLFDPSTILFNASAIFKTTRKQYEFQCLISKRGLPSMLAWIPPMSLHYESQEIHEFRLKFGYDVLMNIFNTNLSGPFRIMPIPPDFQRCDIVFPAGERIYTKASQQEPSHQTHAD